MQISPGLYRLTSTLPGAHQPVNSYLLQTSMGNLLIDPAADCRPDKLPVAPSAILITHLQEEHVAGCFHFSDVPVYVPVGAEYLGEGEEAYYKRDTTWQPPWDWENRGNYEGHFAGARNERPPQQPLPIAAMVRGGDRIFGLQVLSTPGHDKHAVTYMAEQSGVRFAFCGDLIYGDGRLWNWFDCDWDYGPQTGQITLLASARRLGRVPLDTLLPAHGPVIHEPVAALERLCERLKKALRVSEALADPTPINFAEKDSPARGWREISPHVHQWKSGNSAALISQSGNALLIDDGLCHWVPLPERAPHHCAVIDELKQTLDISRIEIVIPTHYHGDHTENIPDLAAREGAQVLALDVVAETIEHPERFNLISTLPWYGAAHDAVKVDRRVAKGTRVRWHEYELEIFHLGGQTFYHAGIALEVDSAKVLFVGDTIGGMSVECEPVLCYNDCEPQTRGWAYAIDQMLTREPDVLICGHGVAVRDPLPLLQEKQKKWKMRLEEYSALNARQNLRLFLSFF